MSHAGPRCADGIERCIAGGGRRPFPDWKDCQHAITDEFEDLAAECMNGTGYAVEPAVERCNDRLGRHRLRQRGEPPQVAIEQDRANGLAGLAAQPSAEYLSGAAPAEIGLEQCGERRPCGDDSEWRCCKACNVSQKRRLILSEWTMQSPAEQRTA